MITPSELKGIRSDDDVIHLLTSLGHEASALELDVEEWACLCGVAPAVGKSDAFLCATTAGVRLFLVSSTSDNASEFCAKLSRYFSRSKSQFKNVVFYYDNRRRLLQIHAAGAGGKARHVDIDCEAPAADALARLNLLAASPGDFRKRVETAVDRADLGKRFFRRFREAVASVAAEIEATCPNESSEERESFALLLLSRLLFLYFVQSKGWLDGNQKFLGQLLTRQERNLYATAIQPLFFGCLNTPVERRGAAAKQLGRIPFLNGGLFEPSAFENRNRGLTLSDGLLRSILTDVFEAFCFSVDENDSGGLHIDPEMLGRVFESLMNEEERASSGTFYTPKRVVDVLTRRALLSWIADGDTAVEQRLEALLRNEAALDPALARLLLERAMSVTLLDPACGSGAFLLSAVHTLERLIRLFHEAAAEPLPPNLRQLIVERSIYGVDLKPEAVRLCELRLWLAIVSDASSAIEDVRPLPNLDRNILQGNSLLTPLDFLGDGRREIYVEWAHALRSHETLLSEYRHASPDEKPMLYRALRQTEHSMAEALLQKSIESDRKEIGMIGASAPLFEVCQLDDAPAIARLEERIAVTTRQIERLRKGELDFFAYDVHFACVRSRGGFDVITGNPPWVRGARLAPSMRALLSERYRYFRRSRGSGFAQSELALAFVERSLDLVAPGGVVSMLLPSKVANADYATALRSDLVARSELLAIDDWTADSKSLFEADTFPLGITFRKSAERKPIQINTSNDSFTIAHSELSSGGAGSPWIFVRPEVGRVIERLRRELPSLEVALGRKPLMGVKTGANRAFFLPDGEVVDEGILLRNSGVIVPFGAVCIALRGRDVRAWQFTSSTWMLWLHGNGGGAPPPWLTAYARAAAVNVGELRLAYVRPEHLGVKVAWKDVSRGLQAVALPASISVGSRDVPLVPNQTLYSLDCVDSEEANVLAALLNSTIANALLLSVCERAKDRHFRFFARTVGSLAIPAIERASKYWQSLAALSIRAHKGVDDRAEIDRVVARAYGVSESELLCLSSYVNATLGR